MICSLASSFSRFQLSHLKNIFRRLLENPSFSIIVRNDFHRNGEIAVSDKDINGLAYAQKRLRLRRALFGCECCDECKSKNAQPSRVSHNIPRSMLREKGLMQSVKENNSFSYACHDIHDVTVCGVKSVEFEVHMSQTLPTLFTHISIIHGFADQQWPLPKASCRCDNFRKNATTSDCATVN